MVVLGGGGESCCQAARALLTAGEMFTCSQQSVCTERVQKQRAPFSRLSHSSPSCESVQQLDGKRGNISE